MRYLKISISVLVAASIQAACTYTQLGHPAAAPTNLPSTIVGDIEWNQAIWNPPLGSAGKPDPAKVDAQFTIIACEQSPAAAGQFFTPCHTVGTGHITSVRSKTLSSGPPGNVSPATVLEARYQIPVVGLSSSESVSVSVQPGAAFQAPPDKNSLTYAIPTDRSTMPLSGGENVVLNWNITIRPNICDD
jgi:hypothetical protein